MREIVDLQQQAFSTYKPTSLLIHYLKKKIKTKIYLVGVKPKTTQFGVGISKEVKISITRAMKEVRNLLKR